MAMLSIGEAVAVAVGKRSVAPQRNRSGRRSFAPVRRGSLAKGSFEDQFFVKFAKGEPDKFARAVKWLCEAGRASKRKARSEQRDMTAIEAILASITTSAVRVFEEMAKLARLCEGQVFPTYDWLAEHTKLGRATIARAIGALENAQLIIKQRRFRHEHDADEGLQYRQTSNVYRLIVPNQLMALLPRWMRPAPPPDDFLHDQSDRIVSTALMLKGLSATDYVKATIGGALGDALVRLAAALDLKAISESHNDPQTLLNIDLQGKNEST